MREIRSPGSVRGAARKGRPYRDVAARRRACRGRRAQLLPLGEQSSQPRHLGFRRLRAFAYVIGAFAFFVGAGTLGFLRGRPEVEARGSFATRSRLPLSVSTR